MMYLLLFWVFFKIGLFTIGGGHAMIPLILQDVVAQDWGISTETLINFIAIAESTPGPFAINIATYVGTVVGQGVNGNLGGLFGAICTTLGVVMPSFIIITLVVKLFARHMQKKNVQVVLKSVNSSVTGLLTSVFLTLLLTVVLGMSSVWSSEVTLDVIGLVAFVVLFALSRIKYKGKTIHPIAIIVLSAIVGVVCYGFIPV